MTRADAPRPVPLLEAQSVGHGFRGLRRPALHEVDLTVLPGAARAIVGQSGCGKSTLLRVLAGLIAPHHGRLLFRGQPLARTSPTVRRTFRREVQLVFQDPFASLNPVKRIGHHLFRPLILAGRVRGPELERRALALLDSVGLETSPAFLARFPHELSGGQRQRVAIARALACEPTLLLADEPTSMLDVSIRVGLLNLLAALRAERGIALVYVTHDLNTARYVADEVHVMHSGHVVEEGPIERVLQQPRHPYTLELLAAIPGSPFAHRVNPTPPEGGDATGPGCPFRARCPSALPVCHRTLPRLEATPEGTRVRCHAPLSGHA